MKKLHIIFILSFSLSFLLISFIVYANQTKISTYYPSPSGNYTKLQLINGAGGTNENYVAGGCFCAQNSLNASGIITVNGTTNCDTTSFGGKTACVNGLPAGCATYANAGTIFADPSNGNLEICQSNGSVSSSPGGCFYRFCTGASCAPAAGSACPNMPNNYIVTPVPATNSTTISGVTAYQCCFNNPGYPTTSPNAYAKSGCFSIFGFGSPTTSMPAACSTVDPNAYDVGCQPIITSKNIVVRTCCYNAGNAGITATSACSACPTNCNDGHCHLQGFTTCSGQPCSANCSTSCVNDQCTCTPNPPCPPYSCSGFDSCGNFCNCISWGGSCVADSTGSYCSTCTPNCSGKNCGDSDSCGGYCLTDNGCISPSFCTPGGTHTCGNAPCCFDESYCAALGPGWTASGPPNWACYCDSGIYMTPSTCFTPVLCGGNCFTYSGNPNSPCAPVQCPANMWCNPEIGNINQICECDAGFYWNGSQCVPGGCTTSQCQSMNPPEVCATSGANAGTCCLPCTQCSSTSYTDSCGDLCPACSGTCNGNTCSTCQEVCSAGCSTQSYTGTNNCSPNDCPPNCPTGYYCVTSNGPCVSS